MLTSMWCDLIIHASHMPGKLNIKADHLSCFQVDCSFLESYSLQLTSVAIPQTLLSSLLLWLGYYRHHCHQHHAAHTLLPWYSFSSLSRELLLCSQHRFISGTLQQFLSALSFLPSAFWHQLHGWPNPNDNFFIRRAINGVANLTSPSLCGKILVSPYLLYSISSCLSNIGVGTY